MSNIRVQKLDTDIEGLIIAGMIVDTNFYREISRATDPLYFQSDQAKILSTCMREFAEANNEQSPGEQIKEIFELNMRELTDDEAKIMRLFLQNVLETYSGREFNTKYALQKAFPYLEERAYEYKIKHIQLLLRKGDIRKVKEAFDQINDDVFRQTTQWQSFSDTSKISNWWGEKQNSAMRFQGELGRYMPPIYRGKLYAMLGPAKRGKSFWLNEWCINGVMDGLNVTKFSLEMSDAEEHERWLERISAKEISSKDKRKYRYPVLDCVYNQTGVCEMKRCSSGTVVADENGNRFEFDKDMDHIPCTECRYDKRENFKPTTWFIEEELPTLTLKEAIEEQNDFDAQYGSDRYRYLTFPIGTASVRDIENALDDLERREGFIPDLVAIDYADIMQKDSSGRDLRFKLRDIWEELSRLAKSRNIIVVTASQGNRNSLYKDRLTADDIAEDISKIMTIDGLFGINEEGHKQKKVTKKDKYWMVQRIETLILRYDEIPTGRQCITLHDRARGQICMDSYII